MKRYPTLLLSLSLSLPCWGQATAPNVAMNAQAIQAHSEFLSNDLLEGRATGSRGYELAAAYVAAQFRQYGLGTVNGLNDYLQSVPLVEATVVLPGSTLLLRRDSGNVTYEVSRDYLPAANFFNANSTLTAPMVFVGYGVNAPEYQYNDFAGVELQGRIAVLLEGAPQRFNAEARNYYAWRDTKYAELVKAGALGVIEIISNDSVDNRPSNWQRAVGLSWLSEMRTTDANDMPLESFPELKLKFRLNSDAAARLFSSGHSFEQIMANARKSEPQSFVMQGAATLSGVTGLRRVDSSNVIGVVRGSDARLQNEYVLVTAHLDNLGRGPTINGDNIYNGMQRNAVGVAMMLDMARAIAATPVKPKRSIIFAAVAAGEKQGQGLQYLLNSGLFNPRNVVAAVALDTPLPLARSRDVLAAGAGDSSIGVELTAVLKQHDMRLTLDDDAEPNMLSDDWAPLLRANIPFLALQSGTRGVGRADIRGLKRSWRQEHMNQPSDDAQNAPQDAAATKALAEINAQTAWQLANSDERPVWYRSSFTYRKFNQ